MHLQRLQITGLKITMTLALQPRAARFWIFALQLVASHWLLSCKPVNAEELPDELAVEQFTSQIQPLLEQYCFDCHANGTYEGGFHLDRFAIDKPHDPSGVLADRETWAKVLKNVRAEVMPPQGSDKPSAEHTQQLASWIKRGPFAIDPDNVDPGRVTIHRLNRLEYRNTIEQLLGVKYNTSEEFPPDAAGLGLDNIADLLTMSPLMLEKYIDAAESVLDGAFPSEYASSVDVAPEDIRGDRDTNGNFLSFNEPPELTYTYRNTIPGAYRLRVALEVVGLTDAQRETIARVLAEQEQKAKEKAEQKRAEQEAKEKTLAEGKTVEEPPKEEVDEETARRRRRFGRFGPPPEPEPLKPAYDAHFVVTVQSGVREPEVVIDANFTQESGSLEFVIDQAWSIEPHKINFNVVKPGSDEPESPIPFFRRGPRQEPLPAPHIKLKSLTITRVPTATGREYFPEPRPSMDSPELESYLREGIARFGLRALRRPLDAETADYLVSEIAENYRASGSLHDSLKPSLAKLLCSPRFLFRTDVTLEQDLDKPWGLIDEYSLASRLSFFFWSSPPDAELLELAAQGQLRENLAKQIERMLGDERINNFIENFSGQWLQTRNVADWTIVESAVLAREGIESKAPILTQSLRAALRDEVTMYFEHILREDRSLLEFVDSDYTFVNEELAKFYGLEEIEGKELRRVELPVGHPRGGVITAGSTLLVTSTTNRTSPVKRGVFVLDNFLGLRPHDPPPNVPSVDAASAGITDHEPTFREMLELHRADALCASCHNLMDPIGLGLDSFNAMGMYRETEFEQPIDTSGRLASGEEFDGIKELKAILKLQRRQDFYRCLTMKMLTYALGRGLDYHDVETVDRIVERLQREDGRFSALIMGIVESSPFQQRRNVESTSDTAAN